RLRRADRVGVAGAAGDVPVRWSCTPGPHPARSAAARGRGGVGWGVAAVPPRGIAAGWRGASAAGGAADQPDVSQGAVKGEGRDESPCVRHQLRVLVTPRRSDGSTAGAGMTIPSLWVLLWEPLQPRAPGHRLDRVKARGGSRTGIRRGAGNPARVPYWPPPQVVSLRIFVTRANS